MSWLLLVKQTVLHKQTTAVVLAHARKWRDTASYSVHASPDFSGTRYNGFDCCCASRSGEYPGIVRLRVSSVAALIVCRSGAVRNNLMSPKADSA